MGLRTEKIPVLSLQNVLGLGNFIKSAFLFYDLLRKIINWKTEQNNIFNLLTGEMLNSVHEMEPRSRKRPRPLFEVTAL